MSPQLTFDEKTGEFTIMGKVTNQIGSPSSTGKTNILQYISWQDTECRTAQGKTIRMTATLAVPNR